MKQLIITIGTVILGCLIYEMIAGDDPDSLKSITAGIINQARAAYG